MAVIYMTGFEPGSLAIANLTQNGAMATAIVRGSWSTYSWRHNGSVSWGGTMASAVSEFYFGFGFYSSENTGISAQIIGFYDPDGTTCHVSLALDAARKLQVFRGALGTTLGTGTATLAVNTWYYIEGHVIISDTVGDFDIRIDGVSDISLAASQDTKNAGSTATCDRFYFGTGTLHDYYVDDFYVCDTTGAVNTAYLGDVRIKGYLPSAAGDTTALTASAGSNYDCVNEVPPNDATDYVYGTGTTEIDTYNIPDTSNVTSVQCARLWWKAQKDDATSVKTADVLKYDTDADTVADAETVGADQALSTSWAYYNAIYNQQPDTTNWSAAKINALQIGVKSR